jgi:hypothetical protein
MVENPVLSNLANARALSESNRNNNKRVAPWTAEEDKRLLQIVLEVGSKGNW